MFSANLQGALSCVLLATLLVAVRHDLLEHRIPNVVCMFALVSGCLINTLASGPAGLAFALEGAALGLGLYLPLYLLRGMGAGDVKLMCAVGSFLGPLDTLLAASIALALGGLMAACIVGARIVQRFRAASDVHGSSITAAGQPTEGSFPFAVAIAAGAVILMWHEGQLALLTTLLG